MLRKARWTVVDVSRHKGKYWRKPKNFEFARSLTTVPIGFEELTKTVAWLPLAVERIETALRPVVILRANESSPSPFVGDDGAWRGGYVPAGLRSFPFSIINYKKEKLLLTILEDEALVNEDPSMGARMFDPLGNMGPELREMTRLLRVLGADMQLAADVAYELSHANCLVPLDPAGSTGDNTAQGLLTVDSDALSGQRLGRETLGVDALQLAYALQFSLPRVTTLQRITEKNIGQSVTPQNLGGIREATEREFVDAFFGAMDGVEDAYSDANAGPSVRQEHSDYTVHRVDR